MFLCVPEGTFVRPGHAADPAIAVWRSGVIAADDCDALLRSLYRRLAPQRATARPAAARVCEPRSDLLSHGCLPRYAGAPAALGRSRIGVERRALGSQDSPSPIAPTSGRLAQAELGGDHAGRDERPAHDIVHEGRQARGGTATLELTRQQAARREP